MDDSGQVLAALTQYISKEVLEGRDEGLESTSPLLAWGVINSLEITRLVAFVRKEFGVEIPATRMAPQHFKDLESITALVMDLRNSR
jgi:acyl carrier protein